MREHVPRVLSMINYIFSTNLQLSNGNLLFLHQETRSYVSCFPLGFCHHIPLYVTVITGAEWKETFSSVGMHAAAAKHRNYLQLMHAVCVRESFCDGICRYQFEVSEFVNLGSSFGAKDFLHFGACALLPVGVLS